MIKFVFKTIIPVFFLLFSLLIKNTFAENVPTKLLFKDFYITPISSYELELTEKIKSLDQKLVKISGYMVKFENDPVGYFLLTPTPIALSEEEDGAANDLPAATLLVKLDPSQINSVVLHQQNQIEIEGLLQIGQEQAADGHIYWTRLQLGKDKTKILNVAEFKDIQTQHKH